MNTTTYEYFVASRFKTGEAILNDMNRLGLEDAMSRLHAVIGLITELDEIQCADSRENLEEELGDYYFYLTALKQVSKWQSKFSDSAILKAWEEARHSGAVLLDFCKKEVMYAKELSVKETEVFRRNVCVMQNYLYFALLDINMIDEKLEQLNMAKLNKRYPVGYTNEAAAARADKTAGE